MNNRTTTSGIDWSKKDWSWHRSNQLYYHNIEFVLNSILNELKEIRKLLENQNREKK